MPVTIQTAGVLKQQIPEELQVDARTVEEALAQLDLSAAGELILLVNGRMAYWQTPLTDGDILKLVPAIGGGATQSPQRSSPYLDSFLNKPEVET